MSNICVKLKQRENSKYRLMLSSDETIFPVFDPESASTSPYTPGATLEDDDWFCIQNVRDTEYSIDLLSETFTTVDLALLTHAEFERIDYLFAFDDRFIFFQVLTKLCDIYIHTTCIEIVIINPNRLQSQFTL